MAVRARFCSSLSGLTNRGYLFMSLRVCVQVRVRGLIKCGLVVEPFVHAHVANHL